MDFSGILEGLSTTTAVTAIVGAGALIAVVSFAVWATKKVAGFFGR
ncbi:capsid protein [Pseudoxanthomonas beigongshangi]